MDWYNSTNGNGCFEIPSYQYANVWIIWITAGVRIVYELWQIYYQRMDYFTEMTNVLEWLCYSLACVYAGSPRNPDPDSFPGQYVCGFFAVWLSWLILLLVGKKVPVHD